MTASTMDDPVPVTMDDPVLVWVADLMPRARRVAAEVGGVPSRNRLMRELRIGAQKASTIRAELARTAGPADPADPVARPGAVPVPHAGTGGSGPRGAAPADNPPQEQTPLADRAGGPDPVAVPAGSGAGPAGPAGRGGAGRPVPAWPVLVLAAPAWVAIWSGWVGLGELTGFGPVHPLPGIWDSLTVNTAITLPVGVETYAAYALRAWLSGDAVPARARRYAQWSAIGSLLLGAAGQVAYHLMAAAGMTAAPWPVTMLVACLPVAVLGMGAALAHLLSAPTISPRGHRPAP